MTLLDLPEDLTAALLSEWLGDGLKPLGRLEVACCNRASRRSWLEVLRRVRINEADVDESVCNFLSWLHDRSVLVGKIIMLIGKEDVQELSEMPSLSIRTTCLDCRRCAMASIPILLPFFPFLTSLDLNRFDQDIPDLSHCCPPLKQLSLRCLPNAAVWLAAVSSTLEELTCELIGEQLVLVLAERCRSLRKLSCSFDESVTALSVSNLCTNNTQLVQVHFFGTQATNAFILTILGACPWIREVALGVCGVIECPALLSSPAIYNLDRMKVWPFEYRSFPSNDGSGRCCEIFVGGRANLEFLGSFPVSIRGIECGDHNAVLGARVLRHMGDNHGHTLEICEIVLDTDVSPATLHYFLSRCPNLVDLSLTPRGMPEALIDDAIIHSLLLWYPRISKLALLGCAVDIINDSIIFVLDKWSATNKLTVLNLRGCHLLTDELLPFIERYCPQLTSLGVRDTSMSKEVVLQFVQSISKNKVFCLIELDIESRDWFKAELRDHGELWRQVCVEW